MQRAHHIASRPAQVALRSPLTLGSSCSCSSLLSGRFIEYGRDMDLSVAYLVMSLLGENLLRLRRRRKDGKFSLPTILRFGVQAIRSIQAVHDIGFLHRVSSRRTSTEGSKRACRCRSNASASVLTCFSVLHAHVLAGHQAVEFRDRFQSRHDSWRSDRFDFSLIGRRFATGGCADESLQNLHH